LIVGALAAGQCASHVMLAAFAGHHHLDAVGWPTGTMFAAHAAAAVVLGLLIGAVECLYVVCVSVLCWLRLFVVRQAAPVGVTAYHDPRLVVAQYFLIGPGRGTRAPPMATA
jgi:hypothetical protein